jgi:hypothetical protein
MQITMYTNTHAHTDYAYIYTEVGCMW